MADVIELSTTDEPKKRFERSVETIACLRKLREHRGESGKELSYAVFEEIIGSDVQRGVGYAALKSARDIAETEDGMVWLADPNKGLRLLSPSDLSRNGLRDLAGVRRRVRRTKTRQEIALENTQALSPEERAQSLAIVSLARLQLSLSKVKSVDKVMAANTTNTDVIPIARTLELFRRRA
jgi:hypothetical protein